MGVDTEYYLLIGIKGDYTDFKYVRDKNELISLQKNDCFDIDSDYFDIDTYKHIIIGDYLPPDYTVISDRMSCRYSIIGKVLDKSEYLDTIKNFSISPEDLEVLREEVYKELQNIGLCDIVKTDVKLISFCHFS